MKTIRFFSFLLVLFFSFGKSQSQTYHVLLDKNFSSISSAESLVSIHHAFYTFEAKLFPNSIGKKNHPTWFKKSSSIFYRLGKWHFYDLPLHNLMTMIQDEVFGKGYQFRNLGFYNNKYGISSPYPYGNNWSFTQRGTLNPSRVIGRMDDIPLYFRGNDATRILSNSVKKKWILSDSIHFKEAMLCVTTFNRSHYPILLFHKSGRNQNIGYYLEQVNALNNIFLPEEYKITSKKLSKKAWINFLNPFVGFALLTATLDYGWHGKTYGKLRWLKFGKIRYLPSFRLGLTPFGDEIFSEHFFKRENKVARFYYRHGNPVFQKHNGFGMETINAVNLSDKILLDFHLDIWSQPPMELGGEELRISKSGLGHLMKMSFQIRLWTKPNPLYLSGQLGYKTDGYIEGEPLSNGLILRYGMAFNL